MCAPGHSSPLRPLLRGGFADWSGPEVTGEDNLVDGWWTGTGLPLAKTFCSACAR
jgi:hypothetical protein